MLLWLRVGHCSLDFLYRPFATLSLAVPKNSRKVDFSVGCIIVLYRFGNGLSFFENVTQLIRGLIVWFARFVCGRFCSRSYPNSIFALPSSVLPPSRAAKSKKEESENFLGRNLWVPLMRTLPVSLNKPASEPLAPGQVRLETDSLYFRPGAGYMDLPKTSGASRTWVVRSVWNP